MPEQTPPPEEESAADLESEATEGKPSIFRKIKIGLFVIGVIAVECLVAKLYLPTAAETAALAGGQAASDGENPLEDQEQPDAEQLNQVEVDMEEFHVTAFQPKTETTLVADFHLWGAVHEDDTARFDELFATSRQRFRDQVISIIRSSEREDLADPGLGLLRRKVVEKANRILGEPLLKGVIISDFSYSVH